MDELESEQLASLVARASRGDEDAWRAIVERCAPRMHAIIRAQCRDDDLAEEIVQSTFCSVVRTLANYEEGGRFESWLMRIAMNRLRDEMRRRGRQAVPTEQTTLVGLAGGAVPEGEPDAGGVAARRLMQALDRLSDADREIIHLRHVGGLGFKQIAEALDTPIGTLLARHHRALRKLRGFLEDLEGGGS
jgi:RNA polymerase sigma-70 factor (ECF subfamily)